MLKKGLKDQENGVLAEQRWMILSRNWTLFFKSKPQVHRASASLSESRRFSLFQGEPIHFHFSTVNFFYCAGGERRSSFFPRPPSVQHFPPEDPIFPPGEPLPGEWDMLRCQQSPRRHSQVKSTRCNNSPRRRYLDTVHLKYFLWIQFITGSPYIHKHYRVPTPPTQTLVGLPWLC